jgi:lysyl-tRNA synthetase class 2
MSGSVDWRPSCTLKILQLRAVMLQAVRAFFAEHDYLEVETPCLSREVVLDAWLEPYEVCAGGQRWILQTSPEAVMKRLLSAGTGSIFQISRVFRSGESGPRHNPEFTMIEWYGVGSTWQDQILLTERLVRSVCRTAATMLGSDLTNAWSEQPFDVIPYADAFRRRFGVSVFDATGIDLIQSAVNHGISLPKSCPGEQVDDILNAMLAIGIEPQLGGRDSDGRLRPAFLCDYPPSQAALAVTSVTVPKVARRFELYIDGIELCNGYQELTDSHELQRREKQQNAARTDSSLPELPGAPRLAAAMAAGLPPCSGVALGFDRLVMIAAGASDIADVLPFPENRA